MKWLLSEKTGRRCCGKCGYEPSVEETNFSGREHHKLVDEHEKVCNEK